MSAYCVTEFSNSCEVAAQTCQQLLSSWPITGLVVAERWLQLTSALGTNLCEPRGNCSQGKLSRGGKIILRLLEREVGEGEEGERILRNRVGKGTGTEARTTKE